MDFKSKVRTIWFEGAVWDVWEKIILILIFALNKNSGRIWIENNNLVHFFFFFYIRTKFPSELFSIKWTWWIINGRHEFVWGRGFACKSHIWPECLFRRTDILNTFFKARLQLACWVWPLCLHLSTVIHKFVVWNITTKHLDKNCLFVS